MKNGLSFLLVTFLFYVEINGYVYQIRPSLPILYPGKCYYKTLNLKMKPNEKHFIMDKCEKLVCNSDLSLTGMGCGSVRTEPPCKVTAKDYSKRYPDCCPNISCP